MSNREQSLPGPNRVPRIVLLYWLIKIASTTLGETGADMFSMTFQFGYGTTILLFLSVFIALFLFKMFLKRYEPVAYWLTFTASAIAGTAISDFIDRTLDLGYGFGSFLLIALLLAVLGIWYLKERSISVEKIHNGPQEAFYWLAFLVANTLGTAAGDCISDDFGIGFLMGSLFFSLILIFTAILYYSTEVSRVLLFWIAFVVTRPFGATFGDFLTKPISEGGLNLGTIGASIFFSLMLLITLAIEVRKKTGSAA